MADSIGERIVARSAFGPHSGASGADLEHAFLNDGSRIVLKTFNPDEDLTMRVVDRRVPLDVVLWQGGVLDRLPAPIGHAVLGAWQEDGAWVLAMRDLGNRLPTYESIVTRAECRRVLQAAGAMHRAFAGRQIAELWPLETRLSVFAPRVMEPYRDHPNRLPASVLEGWQHFANLAPPDVVDLVTTVHARPELLAAPLRRGEQTLLHGDYWLVNTALEPDGVTVIDWGLATWGPPVVEFTSFLVGCASQVQATREEILDDLRSLWGSAHDEQLLRLGLVFGVVEMGWNLAWQAIREPGHGREALDWWVEAARQAADTGLLGTR